MPDPIAVNSMFGRIARRYDLANRVLSAGMDVRWRRRLVEGVASRHPNTILDLATGSGDVAFALRGRLGPSVAITGADFCLPMLEQAEAKQAASGCQHINFQQADALALPFADERFDVVTIAFGLRNLADRARGLREMRRVLRRGGALFVLEFSQPRPPFRAAYYFYLRRLLPSIAGQLTGDRHAYDYLNASISEFPGREALTAEIASAGFSSVRARSFTFGVVALHEALTAAPKPS